MVPCESFNGRRLHSLRHLAHLVDHCEQPFFNFGLEVGAGGGCKGVGLVLWGVLVPSGCWGCATWRT